MSQTNELHADVRQQVGKTSRKLARVGKVPAILYGSDHKPEALELDRSELDRLFAHGGVRSQVLHVHVEGRKTPINAMVKAVQTDPTKSTPIHVDLIVVKMNVAVHAAVALSFVGEAPGVKAGGIFNANHSTLTVEALPGDLPEALEVDISALDIGSTMTLGDVVLPASVTLVGDPDELLASVMAPKVEVEEVVEEGVEGEEEQPEVIGETPEEE
jgi:large subunit ribosomal protein L25